MYVSVRAGMTACMYFDVLNICGGAGRGWGWGFEVLV